MDDQAPLLAIALLADRNKRPGALLLRAAGAVPADDAALAALARTAPVFLPAGGDPVDALLQAGCRVLPAEGWLAGDWYMAPPGKPNQRQLASRALALQLAQLVAADADNHEIEALLRRDPALSYHLLRLVNSLGMGLSKKITSFAQAILILGRNQLRRWLNLMLFSSREGDERGPMLMARAASRARLMELLARECGMDKTGQELAFMAGMFSLLGVLFGMPLEEVLAPLRLDPALSAAVLRHEGDAGSLLRIAELAEAADFAALPALLSAMPLRHEDFNASLLQAHAWAMDVVRDEAGAGHG
ncbi:EAL and HDOD domain-containing protein [Noviherbaspirillum aridicola]|uniref:HDOD domain-containing protein n=1 Tax=Noviherbaspirillum aridicola TaxID=2849687 RepID=A0ABQ4Q9K3_9BURK|nr:HDOD domain-containing protein [Noviherbaspirillum aridicola]GIZ53726.1 hypothetical protein NCCP691_37400 [Noviherbaspirillum aridicola]